jgi:hypothetical protein
MTVDDQVRARLRQAAAGQVGQPDLDAIARGARRGRRRIALAGALASLAVVLVVTVVLTVTPRVELGTARHGATPGESEPGVHHPHLIRVQPERARPGEDVEVFFPESSSRGYAFWLERRRAVGFHPPEWWIEPDFAQVEQGHDVPRYAPADEQFATADGEVWGPGPDLVRVPPEARPGEYRLCAGWDGEVMCARLVVLD